MMYNMIHIIYITLFFKYLMNQISLLNFVCMKSTSVTPFHKISYGS